MRQVPVPPTAAEPRPFRSIASFAQSKTDRRKISMVTAYDAWSARLIARSSVDAILVGDSAAMVVHGHATTVHATVGMMAMHTRAVARGAGDKFLVADVPFLAFRQGTGAAVRAVKALVTSGAHAVKVEGVDGHRHLIEHIVQSGVPVMGHIGLMPQSIHQLGGFHVRGRSEQEADTLRRHAHELQDAGCFAIVLECVAALLAMRLTEELTIPTIGIGAGAGTDGQILVLQDLWGIDSTDHRPRFVRSYCDGSDMLASALNAFDADVKSRSFPGPDESYS